VTETVVDELAELVDLELPSGLVGIPAARRFALARWGGPDSPYALLRSVDIDDLEFVVVPPTSFFPEYAPVLDDDVAAELELTSADDAVVLVIVTVGDPVERSTANLLGPIVVNRTTLRGAQVVLSPEDHDPRHPLLAAAAESARE
jgi:flagellar assembly factor FliW